MQISLNYLDALFCVGTADHLLDDTFSWRIDGKQQAMTVSLLSSPESPRFHYVPFAFRGVILYAA